MAQTPVCKYILSRFTCPGQVVCNFEPCRGIHTCKPAALLDTVVHTECCIWMTCQDSGVQWQCVLLGHVTLVAIAGTIILVLMCAIFKSKSLQLSIRSGTTKDFICYHSSPSTIVICQIGDRSSPILGTSSEPSRKSHTWFEPMGATLAARDHLHTLD